MELGEERVYLTSISKLLYISLRKSGQDSNRAGRNLEAGAGVEAMHGWVLLTGLFLMACSACFLIETMLGPLPCFSAVM